MKPRILIVEDKPSDLRYTISLLRNIRSDDKRDYGIDDFQTDSAEWVAKGAELLKEAATSNRPYDILLLDLELPERQDEPPEDGKGFILLKMAREMEAAHEVVIYTAFPKFANALKALRGGAADFIDKAGADAEKQTRILGAWRRALEKKSDHLLEQRIKQLIPYAEKGVAHRFTACFSEFVQGVVDVAEKIGNYAGERYGLDTRRDAQDALMRALRMHKEAVAKARDQWFHLQSELPGGEADLEVRTVETLLDGIKEDLQPCLMVKATELSLLSTSETKVRAFKDDVYAVLREIIIGGLSGLPNHGSARGIEVTVKVNQENRQAEVQFNDDLDLIPENMVSIINKGLNVVLDKRFERLWGLRVAQQIATRGGGRLFVEQEPERKRNLITCFFPLA